MRTLTNSSLPTKPSIENRKRRYSFMLSGSCSSSAQITKRPAPNPQAFVSPVFKASSATISISPLKGQSPAPKTPMKYSPKSPLLQKTQDLVIFDWPSRVFPCIRLSDFRDKVKLGDGSSSNVFSVNFSYDTKNKYALKEWKDVIPSRALRDMNVNYMRKLFPIVQGHPNIVQHFHFWQEKGYLYLVTELCTGNLSEAISTLLNSRALTEGLFLSFCKDICKGLMRIHEEGLVHLDIKPQNIYVSKAGVLKIGDFGSCRSVGEEVEVSDERYMAPEILNERVSTKADIFSFGIMLYEIITHRPLETSGVAFQDLRNDKVDFTPLDTDQTFIPCQKILNLIRSMMSRDPLKRPDASRILLTLNSFESSRDS